jgi:hypothetical protein
MLSVSSVRFSVNPPRPITKSPGSFPQSSDLLDDGPREPYRDEQQAEIDEEA